MLSPYNWTGPGALNPTIALLKHRWAADQRLVFAWWECRMMLFRVA